MCKQCIMILMAICFSTTVIANNRQQQLRDKIAHLDSVYPTLQFRAQQDTLLNIINYYKELDTILMESIALQDSLLQEYSPYKDILFLLSNDSIVFTQTYVDSIQIPKALEYHFKTIKMVVSARKQIESIEHKILEISTNYAQDVLNSTHVYDLKQSIRVAIEEDMNNVTYLLDEIIERDLSSLSPQQYQYFKPGLTERYNNFLKFFE